LMFGFAFFHPAGALKNPRPEKAPASESRVTTESRVSSVSRPGKSMVDNDIFRKGTDDVSRNVDNIDPVNPYNRMDDRDGTADKTVIHHIFRRTNDRMHTSRQRKLTSLNSKCLLAIF